MTTAFTRALAQLSLGHLLVGVASDNVADLMSEDTGHLIFLFQQFKQAERDKDLTAREGKGVNRFRIREEVKLEIVWGSD